MDPLLRRGLLELGILFGVTRRARDLGVDDGGRRQTCCWRGQKTPV